MTSLPVAMSRIILCVGGIIRQNMVLYKRLWTHDGKELYERI